METSNGYSYLLNILAGVFLASAQSIYIIQVVRKKITPSAITWLGWSLLVGIAFVSQILHYGWDTVLFGHLFSAIGCTFIFLFSFLSKNYVIDKKDWKFLWLGIACIMLYIISKDSLLTTIFAVLADAILGVPTIIKAIKNPLSEKNLGWNLAIGCWILTVFTGLYKDPIFIIFPAYCLAFNLLMSYLTRNRRIRLMKDSI